MYVKVCVLWSVYVKVYTLWSVYVKVYVPWSVYVKVYTLWSVYVKVYVPWSVYVKVYVLWSVYVATIYIQPDSCRRNKLQERQCRKAKGIYIRHHTIIQTEKKRKSSHSIRVSARLPPRGANGGVRREVEFTAERCNQPEPMCTGLDRWEQINRPLNSS